MSTITTHILDTTRGQPAEGIPCTLYQQATEGWTKRAAGITNTDGRIPDLLDARDSLPAGIYRMHFSTAEYFSALGLSSFYPYVEVVFNLHSTAGHHHIPLLLSPFAYSTYRGS